MNQAVWDRFWSKVDASGDCWEWTAGLNWKGYGKFKIDGRTVGAHRIAYEFLIGSIGDLHIDHLCGTRHCVNPDHLEAVTPLVNRQRSKAPRRRKVTHCNHGHEYTEANTYHRSDGWRECRACQKRRRQGFDS